MKTTSFAASSGFQQWGSVPTTVTISHKSSIEMSIVVVGDQNPQLKVDTGSYSGKWVTLTEGVLPFHDRSYTMTNIPKNLVGNLFFQGPIHSGAVALRVITT